MKYIKTLLLIILSISFFASCDFGESPTVDETEILSNLDQLSAMITKDYESSEFAESKKLTTEPIINIDENIAGDFSIDEISNLEDMQNAYGIDFSESDMDFLEENKFLIKDLAETNIEPSEKGNTPYREFLALYNKVKGSSEAMNRKPENALFWTSDIFVHTYNLLYTELLKEIENTVFFPNMKELSKKFYEQSNEKINLSENESEKKKWTKVRNYFAIPYALFETSNPLPTKDDYRKDGEYISPEKVMEDFKAMDKDADKEENTIAFIKQLNLDEESENLILTDIAVIYKAEGKGTPSIFGEEYKKLAEEERITFLVDYTQFTPRSHYTNNSLRRQYFRGMKWYIDTPFFLKSSELTEYAFGITQLLAENEKQLEDYDQLETTIAFLVGNSDDLMPVDYFRAVYSARNAEDKESAVMDYLVKAHNPKIKSLAANFDYVDQFTTEELKIGTKGMRFFSGKFIIDSYWTDYLTQGDEAVQEDYTQKLPPMASSLEVMALLGSDYAKSEIENLDFYTPETKESIDQAMKELEEETANLTNEDWQNNVYYGWLWVIKGLFDWRNENVDKLPAFMQSDNWPVKTLMTASGFWTELRHATILYAKQSFAEMGGMGTDCNEDPIPEAPKGYIEPNYQAYNRLLALAERTESGLTEMKYDLKNIDELQNFIETIKMVMDYTEKELANTEMTEVITDESYEYEYFDDGECNYQKISESDWEDIRLKILGGLETSMPESADGPILEVKDKRAAILADVHTGGDSFTAVQILYEGTGVPKVIFVAVKDANGARLTIGFTYSHYEFRTPYGGKRMTDEDWQENFYEEGEWYEAYNYKDSSNWPEANFWYKPILELSN